MSAHDEPKLTGKCSRNVTENTVCWKFFPVPPKGKCLFKSIFAYFSCSNCEFLGFQFRTGERKTECQKNVNKQKLAGKSLTEHLRRKHGAEKEVGAAFMLDEIRKDDNPTPRQTITKYTKSLSREERGIDRYPRVGTEDIRIT